MSRGGGLKLSGGRFRGRRLVVAPGVRPTEARSREALFDIWGEAVVGARFLDLFAGSGAMGLEALSRGAHEAVFVESGSRVLPVLRANLRLTNGARLLRARLPGGLSKLSGEVFDLAFADPPYTFTAYGELLRLAAPRLEPRGELVVEHASRSEDLLQDEGGVLRLVDRRRYGESCLSFFQPSPDE